LPPFFDFFPAFLVALAPFLAPFFADFLPAFPANLAAFLAALFADFLPALPAFLAAFFNYFLIDFLATFFLRSFPPFLALNAANLSFFIFPQPF